MMGVERKWGRRGNIAGLLPLEGYPMKWTIRVELTPDGNPPITYDIGTITRPIADLSPEQIGLTIEDGQQLLRRIQVKVIASQAHAYALCRRTCVECGRPKRIKDIRTKCVQTVFGAFRFRVRLDLAMPLEALRAPTYVPLPENTDVDIIISEVVVVESRLR